MYSYIYFADPLFSFFKKNIGLSYIISHFMQMMMMMRGMILKDTMMIQVSRTAPVASYNANPKIKDNSPPKL